MKLIKLIIAVIVCSFIILGCTIEDMQDCIKITKVEFKSSGYYLTLQNNVVIHDGYTSDYKVGDYYCFKKKTNP